MTRLALLLSLSLLPMFSCGMPPGEAAGPLREQSGTRLKRQYLVASDGAVGPGWFRDTKLGIDCTFVPTAKGWLCMPLDGTATPDPARYVAAQMVPDPTP